MGAGFKAVNVVLPRPGVPLRTESETEYFFPRLAPLTVHSPFVDFASRERPGATEEGSSNRCGLYRRGARRSFPVVGDGHDAFGARGHASPFFRLSLG